MNRTRLALFILVILFIVSLVWSYNARPRFKTVDTKVVPPVSRKTAAGPANSRHQAVDDGSRLHLDQLDNESAAFTGYRRNIFRQFFYREVKIPKQAVVAVQPPVKVPLPPAVSPVQAVPARPEIIPLARFTFLGFMKKGSVKTIFLAKDKDIILVKKGDVIAGRYRAARISDQELTLTATDADEEIVIPLVESQPLVDANKL